MKKKTLSCTRVYPQSMKKLNIRQFLFCVTVISILLLVNKQQSENLVKELSKNSSNAVYFYYRKNKYYKITKWTEKKHTPRKNITILLWTDSTFYPFNLLINSSQASLPYKCPYSNCFITTKMNLHGKDVASFDAILFNGRNFRKSRNYDYDLPKIRSPHQKYIYVNTESSYNFPVCQQQYDGFFNLTATYRLDSDIVLPYYVIENAIGQIIGPKTNMTWPKVNIKKDNVKENILSKSYAAAWFVSNCNNKTTRKAVAKEIKNLLELHGHTVHIYGKCGEHICPINAKAECEKRLQADYYFYLAFENSLSEDYVTEKVLTALNNRVIPIVYGGANYTRFLPPGTYLDASQPAPALVNKMLTIMMTPKLYMGYLERINAYTYKKWDGHACALCKALNDISVMSHPTVYPDFRKWWEKDFEGHCTDNS